MTTVAIIVAAGKGIRVVAKYQNNGAQLLESLLLLVKLLVLDMDRCVLGVEAWARAMGFPELLPTLRPPPDVLPLPP